MTPQTPRVLLAASGSEASRRATIVAADLASTFNAQLTILHVMPPVEYRVGRLAPTLPITRRLDDPLTSPVLSGARRVAWSRGAGAKTILIAGDPATVIVTVAGELGADLLVIGRNPRLLPSALAREDPTMGARPRPLPRAPRHRRPAAGRASRCRTCPRHLSRSRPSSDPGPRPKLGPRAISGAEE